MVQSPKMRRMFSSELYDYTHSRGKCIHSLETSRRGYCGAGGAPPIHRLPPIGGAMNGWPIMYPTLPAPRPLPILGGPGYKWTEDTRTALSITTDKADHTRGNFCRWRQGNTHTRGNFCHWRQGNTVICVRCAWNIAWYILANRWAVYFPATCRM